MIGMRPGGGGHPDGSEQRAWMHQVVDEMVLGDAEGDAADIFGGLRFLDHIAVHVGGVITCVRPVAGQIESEIHRSCFHRRGDARRAGQRPQLHRRNDKTASLSRSHAGQRVLSIRLRRVAIRLWRVAVRLRLPAIRLRVVADQAPIGSQISIVPRPVRASNLSS